MQSEYVVSEQSRRLWEIEIDMAKLLFDICQKHGLRVWADSGTLLGAVRHHGFIPWDDDMDFVMFRDDFEKLKLIAQNEKLPEPYYLEIRQPLIRIYNANTTMFATDHKYPVKKGEGNGGGVWIDIICLDNIPVVDDDFCVQWKKIWEYDRPANNKNSTCFAKLGGITNKAWHFICMFCNVKKRNKKVDDFCKQYQHIECDTVSKLALYLRMPEFRDAKKLRLFNKQWYDKTVNLPFNGIEIPCPSDYDAVLKSMYGNSYMTPIQQATVHGEVVIDLDRPFEEVVRELLSEVPWYRRYLYKY